MLTLPPIKQEVVELREQQLRAHCIVILIPQYLVGDHLTVVGILLLPPAIDRLFPSDLKTWRILASSWLIGLLHPWHLGLVPRCWDGRNDQPKGILFGWGLGGGVGLTMVSGVAFAWTFALDLVDLALFLFLFLALEDSSLSVDLIVEAGVGVGVFAQEGH